jgi:hypothetical protein
MRAQTRLIAIGAIVTCTVVVGIQPGRAQNGQSGTGSQTSGQSASQNQPAAPARPGNPRMKVPGAPRIQSSPGLGVECTSIEQGIAGAMLGPADLCDR